MLEEPVSSAAARSRLVGVLGAKVSIACVAMVVATVAFPAMSVMPDLMPKVMEPEAILEAGVKLKL